jgi:hypothetical protein
MTKRVTAVLLCLALLWGCLAGCGQEQKPGEARESASQEPAQSQSAAAEEAIPMSDRPQIDWNTAFQMEDLPDGEVSIAEIAFLKLNEDGTKTVLTVPKEKLSENLPKRLPRTRYFEQFMDPAVAEELLPVLDYALYRDCCGMCVPTARLSGSLVGEAACFLSPTYFETYSFSAQGVRRYQEPDGQTVTFLEIRIDNYKDVRDKYRRLDGLNSANAFVDNIPEGLDEAGKMFRIYRWLTETVQPYHGTGSRQEYFSRPTWSLLFDAMLDHVAVDAGYAETLTVLCNLAGIECFTVKSTDHDWNIARIDGQYYHFDPACDRGLTPADFRCFGVSDEAFQAYHGGNLEESLSFSREYCPPCPENLLPDRLDPGTDEDTPASRICAYYELRNARDANPLLLFYRMGYGREEIGTEAPKNGWIRTRVDLETLMELLRGVTTAEQAARFVAGRFERKTEGDSKLSYRAPAENPELTRLVGLEDNGDGTWTARVLRFRSITDFTPDQELVTVVLLDGAWLVADVK